MVDVAVLLARRRALIDQRANANFELAEIDRELAASNRQRRQAKPLTSCAADRDGDCDHPQCPQLRDAEPAKSGRSCPMCAAPEEY